MALVDDIARALASKPRVARWAPILARAATQLADVELGLTPLDLALDFAAIIWRETRGENILGDNGHGHGVPQVDDRSHAEWLAANEDGMNPETAIPFAMGLYVDGLVVIANHQVVHGIQRTSGELRRFAMAAYNVGLHNTRGTAVLDCLERGIDPDTHTTPGLKEYPGTDGELVAKPDYGAATMRERELFAAALGSGACE